jgi:hypothetical protein
MLYLINVDGGSSSLDYSVILEGPPGQNLYELYKHFEEETKWPHTTNKFVTWLTFNGFEQVHYEEVVFNEL